MDANFPIQLCGIRAESNSRTVHTGIQIQHRAQRLFSAGGHCGQHLEVKLGTDDGGDPGVRVGRGQVAKTLDLALLDLRVRENRLACAGLEHHCQFLQRGALESVNPKLDLFARDCLRFVRLDVGYQVLATTRHFADTSNIVVHHVLEEQHGRRFQYVRVGNTIILVGDHWCTR
jgi:hypothetical protein